MKEIRIHGRAGQGAITTATLLALAAFEDGKEAQAFPHFGAERMGAPLNAFVRLDSSPIRLRSQVKTPDYVLVLDPTLLRGYDVTSGLKDQGLVIINSPLQPEELGLKARVVTVPAARIAEEMLGRADRANTAILGAFAITGEVTLEALKEAARHRFPGNVGEKNALAMERAYQWVKGGG